ncbi:hypothetical protein K505DRAFT_261864, partial [Melanomma pulvis-pyrius CBS 109.77]
LTFVANTIIIDLAKLANVILIMLYIVSKAYAYSISTVRCVLYNKARKAPKLASLAGFV